MAKKYYAAHNSYGTNLTYNSIGWRFLAFESKAARDAYVDDHAYDQSGNIVTEPIATKDIPHNSHTAIVKEYDVEYPAGCIGEIGDRWNSGYTVESDF